MRKPDRMRGRDTFVLFAAAAVLLVGCSSGEGLTSVRAGQQSEAGGPTTIAPPPERGPSSAVSPPRADATPSVSPTVPQPPRSAPEPPPIPRIEPLEAQLRNDNVRDGRLGSLCWARWEINRQIRVGLSSVENAQVQGVVSTLRDELPSIAGELNSLVGQLPSELHLFLGRLRADVGLAQDSLRNQGDARMVLQDLARQFQFDSYPGVGQYRRLASEHPACTHL